MGWLKGWNRYATATIPQNAGAAAAFQVPLTVYRDEGVNSEGVFHCDGTGAPDFSDLRFTQSDGVTTEAYWIQNEATAESDGYASCWIKVSGDISAGNVTIGVYWNAPGTKSLSSQADTFVDVISGVVGAWNMEETAGANVADSSGNGNNGLATNTSIIDGYWAGKKARQCISTNNDKIVIPKNADLDFGSGDFTIATIMKTTLGDDGRPFDKRDQATGVGWWFYQYNTKTDMYIRDSALNTAVTANNVTTNNGSWHSIVSFRSADEINIRIDGALQTAQSCAGFGNINADFDVELGVWAGSYQSASFSGLYFFNSALSDAQQISLFSGYPDSYLEAGKVLVRKYASTTQPTFTTFTQTSYLFTPAQISNYPSRRQTAKIIRRQKQVEFLQVLKLYYEHKANRSEINA